jgi:hypothetical protein
VNKLAIKIVDALIADITDRRGLRQAWESIDDDTQREMVLTWRQIVRKLLLEAETKDFEM